MQTNQRATVATLLGLLLGFGLMQMGNTLQGTLLSIRGGIESFSPTQIGAVGAGFWVGIVIGSLRAGKVVQSVGHIRAFLAFGAVASTAPLLHLLVIDPIAWVVARALTGFCFAGLFIVVESWLNSAATDQTRGQILSVYAMTGLLAGIVGQLLLPTTDPAGFRPFCVVAIIIAFALVPIALTRAVAPAHEGGGARINLRALYQQSPFGLVAAFLCGVTASAFFTLGPVFAQLQGLDTRGVAAFMAFGTLGGFLMAWPVGLLSDRFDRRFVIIGAALTATASLFTMMALVPEEPSRWILYLCVAIFGGTIVPTYSVVMAHVNDAVGEGEFVAASGGLLIMQGAGAAAGPLLAGFAMSASKHGLGYTLIVTQILMAVLECIARHAGQLRPRCIKELSWSSRRSQLGLGSREEVELNTEVEKSSLWQGRLSETAEGPAEAPLPNAGPTNPDRVGSRRLRTVTLPHHRTCRFGLLKPP